MPVYATFYAGEDVESEPVGILDWPDVDVMSAFMQAGMADPSIFPFGWEAMVYHGDQPPESDLPTSRRYSIVVEAILPGMSMN